MQPQFFCPFCNQNHLPHECPHSPLGKYFLTDAQLKELKGHLSQLLPHIPAEMKTRAYAIGHTLNNLEKFSI